MNIKKYLTGVLLNVVFITISNAAEYPIPPSVDPSATLPTLASQQAEIKPPKVIHMDLPTYPILLGRSGNKGKVVIKTAIDADGKVEPLDAVESDHPAFEKAAVLTLLEAKFKPATQDGQPIKSVIAMPFKFFIRMSQNNGSSTFFFLGKADSKLPAELQYDNPPQIKFAGPLVYPLELLKENITGSAKVSVLVDPDGNVREVNILEATHPAFGLATKAMMESWTFKPATKDGKPSWALFNNNQIFNLKLRDTYHDDNALRLLEELQEAHPIKEDYPKIYKLSELDTPPKALYQPQPPYPIKLRQQKISDTVMVEFYIDSTGTVQLPHILKFANEDLAWIALTTVSRWLFEPPKVNGEPVDAIVSIPIAFSAK